MWAGTAAGCCGCICERLEILWISLRNINEFNEQVCFKFSEFMTKWTNSSYDSSIFHDRCCKKMTFWSLQGNFVPLFRRSLLFILHRDSVPSRNGDYIFILVKGKAVPAQVWTDPEGSRRLRFPGFLDSIHTKVVRLSTLSTGHLYPGRNTPVLISVRGWVDRRTVELREGLCQWKIPVTPSGIEPATIRLVAQLLNQLRHRQVTLGRRGKKYICYTV